MYQFIFLLCHFLPFSGSLSLVLSLEKNDENRGGKMVYNKWIERFHFTFKWIYMILLLHRSTAKKPEFILYYWLLWPFSGRIVSRQWLIFIYVCNKKENINHWRRARTLFDEWLVSIIGHKTIFITIDTYSPRIFS